MSRTNKKCKPLDVPTDRNEYDLEACLQRPYKYIVTASNTARANGYPLEPRYVQIGILQACEDAGIDLSGCADVSDVQAVVMAYLMAGRRTIEGGVKA